jgi:sigma-E factor negative regulatory protein RseB
VNWAPHPPRGAVRRRAAIAVGTAGLVITGVFIAGSNDSPPAQPRPARQPAPHAAKLPGTGAGAGAHTGRLGAVVKLAGPAAVAEGTRLIGEAATATRAVPYQAVQVISWRTPGASFAWLGSTPGQVTVPVSHHTGQPPDVVLGLSPTLAGLLDAHYVAVYTGQGSAAGRPASVVEVCRPDGSVAARFWLDDSTKLPLRRELFDSQARLISVDGLAGLKIPAGAAKFAGAGGTRPATGRAAPATNGTPVWSAAAAGLRHAAAANISAAMSMAGFAGAALTTAGPAAAPARPWADRLGRAQLAAMRTGGWPVPSAMPGGLTLYGARQSGTRSGRVLDLAYSDGLSVISLFLQRGRLPAALPGWRQTRIGGHPVYLRNPAEPDLAWAAGGYVYTVVAGAPAAVIASVVDSLSHQGRPGFWGRMDRGMRRVFSWINPFR